MSAHVAGSVRTGGIRRYVFPALAMVIVVVLAANRLFRDERQIDRAFQAALTLGSKTEMESAIVSAARAAELTTLFSTNLTFRLGSSGMTVRNRSDLQTLAYRARTYADTIRVKSLGHSIEIGTHRSEARMDASIEAVVQTQEHVDREVGEFRILWKKEDGTWRIWHVEAIETIRRPRLWDEWAP